MFYLKDKRMSRKYSLKRIFVYHTDIKIAISRVWTFLDTIIKLADIFIIKMGLHEFHRSVH